MKQTFKYSGLLLILFFLFVHQAESQDFMINAFSRENKQSLNGKWDAIVDAYSRGERMRIFRDQKPTSNTHFLEYSFDGGLQLNVPGDWNHQSPELKYYEGNMWYRRKFQVNKQPDKRAFLYFDASNYITKVWLNGTLLGTHEGGFTPFQFEITDLLKSENTLVVLVNNDRTPASIPAMNFDWWNFGGITRDVSIIYTPQTYIKDYFVRLRADNEIECVVELAGNEKESILFEIPELKIKQKMEHGKPVVIRKKLQNWSPEVPKTYQVKFSAGEDAIQEEIAFRTIKVEGTKVLLNNKPIFMKSISFHEEIPQEYRRAVSHADAVYLLNEAKALGCNMVRLAHYPQSEYIVRLAEKMGIMLWEEIPLWQHIDFADTVFMKKAENYVAEMIHRDKNRGAIITWGVANETFPDAPLRNERLKELVQFVRTKDGSRLITAAFDNMAYDFETNTFTLNDPLTELLDFVSVNKYMGWYMPFPTKPENIQWRVALDKPLMVSEFGGEAGTGIYGQDSVASSWSEDYQAKLFEDNLKMFQNMPNLSGVSPWILLDFRSPFRMHPIKQEGWNRKGVLSDKGIRKKSWKIMKEYYETKQ